MKIGLIDYYLDEWHANNYPRMIHEISGGEMEAVCAYGMIDSPIGGRSTAQWCADMGIPRAYTIEEVIDTCDGLIVLSPDNCEMHEQLCQLPLRSGKPTYVDKTFAPDYETARRIFDIAESHGTPCYSTSALRFADEYRGIKNVRAICSWGPGSFETYAIHQLEPIMMLMQAQPASVMYLPGDRFYSLVIAFEGGKTATIAGCADESTFTMHIATQDGAQTVQANSDYFHHFIARLIDFFRDPSLIVPHEETLRIMAVRGAGLKAIASPMTWVSL